jgi:hypothetical protein
MSWKGMQEHLRSLQERRQQLESSIVIDPDASILSNMTEMIRLRSDPFSPIYKFPGFPHAFPSLPISEHIVQQT